ncbi:MAG: imidazolonepropionase [Ferruginibacter sp.]
MTMLLTNIKTLIGCHAPLLPLRGDDLASLNAIENAFVLVEDGLVADFGAMQDLSWKVPHPPKEVYDCSNRMVLPCWCDSHTHLVFAGSRENEFVDKIRGLSYAEIAARGGGILNSAARLNETSKDELFCLAWQRLKQITVTGTGSVEIKSGYGLSVEGELKMLRVIKKLKEKSSLQIKSSFLAAHTYPSEYRENHEGYIKLILEEMLPVIVRENLADYIDVFCEQGFFSIEEMISVCKVAARHGLKPKLHINQLNSIGGLQAAIALNALSVDHLEVMTGEDVKDLAASDTIGTLLPTAAYFLRMPFQPARKLMDAGAAIALASDYNPGSSPSGNMQGVVSMACIGMRMLPAEAINAATINGAFAMEVADSAGSIAIDKRADLIVTKEIPSVDYLPYAFGEYHIARVMIKGEWQ